MKKDFLQIGILGFLTKTFHFLLALLLGKDFIENATNPIQLLRLAFNGFIAIILVVMIRNLYPLFLKASRVLNFGWEIDSIQQQLVAHSFAIVLLGLMLVSLVLADRLLFANINGENGKRTKYVVWITSLTFSVALMIGNAYQFANKDVIKNIDTKKYAKIDLFGDKSTQSFEKQIDRLNKVYDNQIALQKESLDKASILQKRSNINIIGNEAVKINKIDITNYEKVAAVHLAKSETILKEIKNLENRKSENVLVLKDQNASIQSSFDSEVNYYTVLGYAKGCFLEILLLLFIVGSHFLDGKVQNFNTVVSEITHNNKQNNKVIEQSEKKDVKLNMPNISIPKLKVRTPNFVRNLKEKIFVTQQPQQVANNSFNLDSVIVDTEEIESVGNETTVYESTIHLFSKELGLNNKSAKYLSLKETELKDMFRFVCGLDVINKGTKFAIGRYANLITSLYNISQDDFISDINSMKSKFIKKRSVTKTNILQFMDLENEYIGGAGYKPLI